ncbi:MAG: hypothetical protein M2R45_04043 [Verrucomicrobia subdivision 3 bacterium]|nr:hypothetical protein [Limisphaerales bacterium]MCS1416973.1 hypothetical protein [Limisphaerales bacterium]
MVERVMIIDPGESATLILIAERILRQVQIREHITIPTKLASSNSLIAETLEELRSQHDPIRVYLIIPQSETVSQRITLDQKTIDEFITTEANQFQKIEGTEPVFDHQPLAETSENTHWLTYCQEPAIKQRLHHLGLNFDDIDDVTSAAQGLWGVFENIRPSNDNTFIIDLGRHHTALMQICDGQPQYATSFSSPLPPNNAIPANEHLKRWFHHLCKAPSNLSGNPQETLQLTTQDHLILIGEKALIEPTSNYLREEIESEVTVVESSADERHMPPEFATALGVARSSLRLTKLQISLLPKAYQHQKKQKFFWNRLRGWTSALALTTIIFLLIGTWQKITLFRIKDDLLKATQAAIAKTSATEDTLAAFAKQYELVRPILRYQQETTELIETFTALQPVAKDPSYWLVLLADFDSYYSKTTIPISTNDPEPVNNVTYSNRFTGNPGFVAEFSFLDQGEAMRSKLLSLVNRLNESKTYLNVDTLAEDIRRPLAKTNVLLADRHIALALELHRNYFTQKLSLGATETASALEKANPSPNTSPSFNDRNGRIEPQREAP